jgi:hypothetical protein
MKFQVYPTVIVAFLLGLVGLVLGLFQFSISIEPAEPESLTQEPPGESQLQSTLSVEPDTPSSVPSSAPTPTEALQQDSPEVSESKSAKVGARQNVLRIRNVSEQPVRIALLARRSATGSASRKSTYGVPAHWDFAPKEGSEKGLVLSLPDGNLKLEKGDILVAFAQDGSRRYWGPYVVGETALPLWNSAASEWELVVK